MSRRPAIRGKGSTKPDQVSVELDYIDKVIGMAKGPKRRMWDTIGELEIFVDSEGSVVLCKGHREHGPSLEHPWLELTQDELQAFLARGDELLRAGRRGSRGTASNALNIRPPRFLLRAGDKTFPFLRNVERAEATARLADYVEDARRGPIVVTMRGRPIAFLASVTDSDLEDLSIGTDPGFLEILRRSRESLKGRGSVPLAGTRRQSTDKRKKGRRQRGLR